MLFLKTSISKAKKFFQRTIQSFKSLVMSNNGTYHKIPKTTHIDSFSYRNDYVESTRGTIVSDPQILKLEVTKFPDNNEKNATMKKETISQGAMARKQEREEQGEKYSSLLREKRADFVIEKFKEMVVMMKMGDVEHVLDIEEVLHYYSLLSCPAYLDIVHKFFMDMHCEFVDHGFIAH